MKKNKLIFQLSVLMFSISCSTVEKESVHEKDEKKVVSEINNEPDFIDEKIGSITFGDSSNVIINYGDLESQILESDNSQPQVGITNIEKNEFVVLSKWYGDGRNEFKYCHVVDLKDDLDKELYFVDSKHQIFITGKGIKLGITQKELLEKLGKGYDILDMDNYKVIKYEDADILYQSNYYLRDDKLVKFDFGFLAP